tara:strand:- start:331 stop:1176 length:846 start_codon:yes stop_codon:yes gene_type:complete
MADTEGFELPETVKDVGLAIGSVVIVFLLTFAYSGNWPPMVVIESGSMEHDNNPLYSEPRYSHIGTIDTGDLVVVKKAEKSDIVTYLEGKKTDYKKYGDYGDVIVYYKNGIETYEGQPVTPVIHRAMAWVEVIDKENETYYIPEIDTTFQGKIQLAEIGLGGGASIQNLQNSGYITKGDSTGNPHPDQLTHYDITGAPVQPVDPNWVVGMAKGELPWFGLIKLRVTQPDNYYEAPPQCRTMLWMSMLIVLAGPVLVGQLWDNYQSRNNVSSISKPDKKRKE